MSGAAPELFGLGLRPPHYQYVLDQNPPTGWFEVISENFFVDGGKPRYFLRAIRERYPIALHGVSMSIGSSEPLDLAYLDRLTELVRTTDPLFVSDHLCWTGIGGTNSHDLLPLPFNEASLGHLVERVNEVQDRLQCQLLLENVSAYVTFQSSSIQEAEFLNALAQETGCGLLLDVNNIYVNARNLGIDAHSYIQALNPAYVKQIHLAGHTDNGDHVIDTHDAPIRPRVFELFREAWQRFGPVPSMIERDDKIPEFDDLQDELDVVRAVVSSE